MSYKIKRKNLLLLILISIFIVLVGFFFIVEFEKPERVVLPIGIASIFSGFLFLILNYFCKDKFCSKIFLIAILIHFIFILLWQILKYYLLGVEIPTEYTFNPFISDNDGSRYHELGYEISKNYGLTILMQKYYGGLFPLIVATIYYFIAYNPFLVTILNSILSSFSVILFYLIGKEVIPDKNNLKTYTLLTILCTSYIVNTSVMIRDSYIVFFMYLSVFLSIQLVKKRKIIYFIETVLSLFLLYKFRPYACYVLFFATLSAYCVTKLKFSKQNCLIKTNTFSLIMGILSPVLIIGILCILACIFSSMNFFSLEDLVEFREAAYTGSTSDYPWSFASLYNIFPLLPFLVGYCCLFFAPFPFEWFFVKRLHFVPDMLILYVLLPSFFKNLTLPFRTKNYITLVYLFAVFFMFGIYCITVANSGTIHRLRGPFIPMIYLLAFIRPQPLLNKILYKIKKLEII